MSATDHPGDKLSAYLDGELSPAERAAVDVHLGECAACAQLVEELAAVDSFSRTLAVPAPEGYFDAFPRRVRERLVARRGRRIPAWTWAAAAALLLAVVTPLTLHERSRAPASADMRDGPEEPSFRRAQPAPAAPAATPPPATLVADQEESLRSLGYADRISPRPAEKQLELRQKRDAATGDRLRERDTDAAANRAVAGIVGGAAASGRRDGELKDAKLKKEAFEETGADKAQHNAAPPPAAAPAEPVTESVVVAQSPQLGASVDESSAKSRAEPQRQRPAGGKAPPAAAPPADAYAAKPSPAEGALRATKAAGAPPTTLSADDLGFAREFEAQASRPLRTAEEARQAARQWEELARRHPRAPAADEARVRAIEALATAFRLERQDADRDRAREAAQAYLAGPGALKDRVRAVLDQLAR